MYTTELVSGGSSPGYSYLETLVLTCTDSQHLHSDRARHCYSYSSDSHAHISTYIHLECYPLLTYSLWTSSSANPSEHKSLYCLVNGPNVNLISTHKYKIINKQTLKVVFLNFYRVQLVKRDCDLKNSDPCGETVAQPKLPECHTASQSSLKRHTTSNSKYRPCDYQKYVKKYYECKVCDKYFTCLGSLKKHKKNHAGGKQYKCKYC